MKKNVLIKNIFLKNELKELYDLINHQINSVEEWELRYPGDEYKGHPIQEVSSIPIKNESMGRVSIHNVKVPEIIVEKLKKRIEDEGFIHYTYQNANTYLEYNFNAGNPKLPAHIDKTEYPDSLMIDFQLDSNTSWPITIENENFILNNNEAITFFGVQQMHGRPFKKFENSEYVKNIIFRFRPNNE